MTNETNGTYKELKEEFRKATAKIIIFKTDKTRKVPTEKAQVEKYLKNLLTAYNTFSQYTISIIDAQAPKTRENIVKRFEESYKPRVIESLEVFGYTCPIPNNFDFFEPTEISHISKDQTATNTPQDLDTASGGISQTGTSNKTGTSDIGDPTIQTNDSVEKPTDQPTEKSTENTVNQPSTTSGSQNTDRTTESELNQPLNLQNTGNSRRNSDSSDNSEIVFEPQPVITMAEQTIEQFIKSAGSILNYKYGGNPLKLNGFIRDVKIVRKLAKSEETKEFCVEYVLSHLEERAEEIVPVETASIDNIITLLQDKISADSIKIIEGQIAALKIENNNYSKYAKRAEEVAENYRRSLVGSGIPSDNADQMTIDKFKELCRKNSRSSTAKSVIDAKEYKCAKDVISEFVIQNTNATEEFKEKQMQRTKYGNNSQRGKPFPRKFENNNRTNDNRNSYHGSRVYQNSSGARTSGYNNHTQNRNYGNQYGNHNQRGGNNSNRGGYRNNNSNREQVIRIVTNPQPGSSNDRHNQNGQDEQNFRLT